MKTTIDYGNYTVTVRVLKPDMEFEAAPEVYNGQAFWADFMKAGQVVKAPKRTATAEDYRHGNNLLRKYTREELKEYVRIFWNRYSQPLFENPDMPVMRLFVSRLPFIQKEV